MPAMLGQRFMRVWLRGWRLVCTDAQLLVRDGLDCTFASAVLVLQRVLFFAVVLLVALAQRVLVVVLGEDRVTLQVTIDAVTGYV